jgi:hypothetical protein
MDGWMDGWMVVEAKGIREKSASSISDSKLFLHDVSS